MVDIVVDVFNKLVTSSLKGRTGANSYEDMLSVVEQLVAVQSKHQSIYAKHINKTYKALDKADQRIREFSIKHSKNIVKLDSKNRLRKVVNIAAGIPAILLSEQAAGLQARQYMYESLNKTLKSIAAEVGGGVLSEDLIEQLLHSRVKISKARQDAERFTTDWFNKIWKSIDLTDPKNKHAMPVKTREALTNIMFRTDLSSLLHTSVGLTSQEISKLIGDSNAIAKQQRIIQSKLGNMSKTHPALKYASELGEYIITGNTYLRNSHMNAYTLANKFIKNATSETVALIDAYATLSALTNTDSNERNLVTELVDNEFAANATENGFIDMLGSHTAFKLKSIKYLFKGNPTQSVKGYIVERIDNLTSTKTGTIAEAAQMKKAGYTEGFPLSDIPGVDQTHEMIYVTRNTAEITDASGIMSTTNQRNMGTTLTEIFSKDPIYQDPDGTINFKKISQNVKKFIREELLGH